MTDLRAELDAALRAITPGDAPVEGALRRGRRLRFRRRAAAVAAAAAVAVFVAAWYPALARHSGAAVPAPAQHQRIVVTDEPPPNRSANGAIPDGDHGVIALGQVGGSSWEVIASSSPAPRPDGPSGKPGCYAVEVTPHQASGSPVYGSGLSSVDCGLEWIGGPGVELTGFGVYAAGQGLNVQVGVVLSAVSYIVVTLSDGQQLKLIPVTYRGVRLVAYVAPSSLRTASATAHLANGSVRTAVPFSRPGMVPYFGLWARPGDRIPPTASGVLQMGASPGVVIRDAVTAYEGPWGTCFVAASGAEGCKPWGQPSPNEVIFSSGGVFSGSAAPDVSFFHVTLTSGAWIRVPVTTVGDGKLWAFWLGAGQHAKTITAYDNSGRPDWTGPVPPGSSAAPGVRILHAS